MRALTDTVATVWTALISTTVLGHHAEMAWAHAQTPAPTLSTARAMLDTRSVAGPVLRSTRAKTPKRTHVISTLHATMMDLVSTAVHATMDTVETA